MKEVLVILADGFEELEALAPVDMLKRSGCNVTLASLNPDEAALSSRNIRITADTSLEKVLSKTFDAVVLPGGMPGALNLAANENVRKLTVEAFNRNALVCAICASPAVVLASFGLLDGKKAVCYPGMETENKKITWKTDRVLRDENIITARGAGCAVDFALEIVRSLVSYEAAEKLKVQIVY